VVPSIAKHGQRNSGQGSLLFRLQEYSEVVKNSTYMWGLQILLDFEWWIVYGWSHNNFLMTTVFYVFWGTSYQTYYVLDLYWQNSKWILWCLQPKPS
jgi:hypothetical protein